MSYAGHHPVHAGLQNASVGDIYPLAIVGYGYGSTTLYVIENLVTGCVLAWCDKSPRQWNSPSVARAYIDDVRTRYKHIDNKEVWYNKRPVFSEIAGELRLVWPTAPKITTRKVLTRPLTPREEYYAAAEQDIG